MYLSNLSVSGCAQKRKMATWLDVMSRPNEKTCPFCSIDPSSVVAGNELVFAICDAYPVTPLHTLVLPRRHVSGYFDLYLPEMMGIDELLRQLRNDIAKPITRSKDSMWASTSAQWPVKQFIIVMFT